jgi:hypothetical protein
MIMTVHTSRRALFGGAGLIAVAALAECGSTPAHAAAVNPRLLRVLALRDFAEAQCERFDEEVEMPARRAHPAAVAAIEARAAQLSNREYHLWQLAVTMPVSSMADVTTKLAFVERVGRTDFDGFVLRHIAADIRRLAGEA